MKLTPPFIAGFAALVLAGCVANASRAQSGLNTRFSGYLEHQYSLSRANKSWRQVDYDRFRAELDVRTRQGSRASVAIVYQLYRGDTDIDPAQFLPQGLLPGVDSLGLNLEDRHFLNHAYVAVPISRWLEVTAGKQYLTWGAAWVFNPTELFRPKNRLEPSYDREGVGALSARVALGPLSDLLVAYVPDGSVEESGKVARLRHHVAGFDLSALAAVRTETVSGFGTTLRGERRTVIGGDVTGELLGLGVWAEAAWSHQEGDRWGELTLGGNYSLSDGTLMLLEAYFDGRGNTDAPYPAQAWLERLSGNRLSVGRTNIFGMISRAFGQFWTIGVSAIGNPGDASFVIVPSVAYSLGDNVDLLFNGVWYAGNTGDEYGFDQTGGFLRGRIYF
jgi:hypothetical protein